MLSNFVYFTGTQLFQMIILQEQVHVIVVYMVL